MAKSPQANVAEPQPSAETPRQPRRQTTVPRGDVTGRVKEALQQEHAAEQAAAAKRMGIANADQQKSISDDVVDYSDPNAPLLVHKDGTTEPYVPDAEAENVEDHDADQPQPGEVPIGGGTSLLPEPVADPTSGEEIEGWAMMSEEARQEMMNEKVVVKINGDYEDVTLGKDVTLSFEYGRRYRMPRWQAMHLDEKGMVWH